MSLVNTQNRYAYLICVNAGGNNNKYYQITENSDGSSDVEYGRVGATNPQHKHYERWEKSFDELFRTRLSHGYVDETNAHHSVNAKIAFQKEEDEAVADEISHLYEISRQFANKYYVNPSAISDKQFREARDILNRISNIYNDKVQKGETFITSADFYWVNSKLGELFTTAPRKMSRVSDFLMQGQTVKELFDIIERETELLNNLEVVVSQSAPAKENQTLSEKFGINMEQCTYKEEDMIKDLLHYKYEGSEAWKKDRYERDNSESLVKVFKVTNSKTKEAYEKCCKDLKIAEKDRKLLFHGSDGQNFLSIMSKGLQLNADRMGLAYATGKGLGQGLYFADDATKALNYSSGDKYVALFEVAMGKPYETDTYFGDVGSIRVGNKTLSRGMGYNDLPNGTQSVYYKGGNNRGRHEICIYKQEQCDIRYLLVCEPYRTKDIHFSLRLSVPFKDLERKGDKMTATAEVSDYCKEQLQKIPSAPMKEDIETVTGKYDIKKNEFSLYINGKKQTLTSDENSRLFRDFKKSFFESEKAFREDITGAKGKTISEKEVEEELER